METQQHRQGLINLYESQIDSNTPFMSAVLENAIHRLENGANPKKVENWVVKLEKLFRENLS